MHLLAAIALALILHLCLVAALDLRDLPGPGGTHLVIDLATGQTTQGLSSWLGRPLAALLGPVAGVRVLASAAVLGAISGAALAGQALGGRRSGVLAAVLVAGWSLSAMQGWLLGGGVVAWGLSWLGCGLLWHGCEQKHPALCALGSGLLVLGAAAKPTALAVFPFALPGILLADAGRLRLVGAGLLGGVVALLPAWLTLSQTAPWMTQQAVTTLQSPGVIAVLTGLAPQGRLPVVAALALLAAMLSEKRPAALAAVVLVAAGAVLIADARGDRLQPRHLLPLSFGLLVPLSALAARSRILGVALVVLALADTAAWSHAFAEQRTTYLQTAASRLPRPPWPTYPPPEWVTFHGSSTPGAVELMTLASADPDGVVGLPLSDRRESHLQAAAAIAGHPARILTAARCCQRGEPVADCAARVASDHRASAATAVLPGKSHAVPQEHRAFAAALISALSPRGSRGRQRWQVTEGRGSGEMACTTR